MSRRATPTAAAASNPGACFLPQPTSTYGSTPGSIYTNALRDNNVLDYVEKDEAPSQYMLQSQMERVSLSSDPVVKTGTSTFQSNKMAQAEMMSKYASVSTGRRTVKISVQSTVPTTYCQCPDC